jgi:hypothetical protein
MCRGGASPREMGRLHESLMKISFWHLARASIPNYRPIATNPSATPSVRAVKVGAA